MKESFTDFIFGTHHTKKSKDVFKACAFFCMLPSKTVKFYKSEIASIFIFVEESFTEVLNLKKELLNVIKEGYLFCKKLDDLQEKIATVDTTCMNSFHKATYLRY